MRVEHLHVVSVQTSEVRGGGEYANVDLLDALAARGVRVKLLTNQPELVTGTSVPVDAIDLGPKLSRRSVGRVAATFARSYVRLVSALRREAAAGGPYVLLLHYKKEQLLAALLPVRLGRAIVWAEWGPLPPEFRRGPARLVFLAAARRTQHVLAVSEGTRRSLVSVGVPADKITVVPPMVDVGGIAFDGAARERYRRAWGATKDTFVVGCVTRLRARKRNDVVVDALAYMRPDTLLVMAADGADDASLRERAAAGGRRVLFLPRLRGVAGQVLSACDVQVFAPGPTEGAPRSILFGQLAERPVVATAPEGCEGAIAAGMGMIVSPPNDPRALAACLEEYRADPERRLREGRLGRVRAIERHDPERLLARIEGVLREVGTSL